MFGGGGFAVEGAGGFAGEFQATGGFAEGDGLFFEDDGGGMPGLDGGGLGAAVGEFIKSIEQGADGGLGVPDGELREGELVGLGDLEEGAVGGHEVGDELVGVDGFAVDLVVDGGLEGWVGLGGEHGWLRGWGKRGASIRGPKTRFARKNRVESCGGCSESA